MKTISLPWFVFWMCCLAVVTFVIVRILERTEATQDDVSDLKNRVYQIELRNIRQKERWGWVSRIGSRIPLVKHLFYCD